MTFSSFHFASGLVYLAQLGAAGGESVDGDEGSPANTRSSLTFRPGCPRLFGTRDQFYGKSLSKVYRMIRVHYIYCAVYFCYDRVCFTSDHQASGPGGWGPLVCAVNPLRHQHRMQRTSQSVTHQKGAERLEVHKSSSLRRRSADFCVPSPAQTSLRIQCCTPSRIF